MMHLFETKSESTKNSSCYGPGCCVDKQTKDEPDYDYAQEDKDWLPEPKLRGENIEI